MHFVSHCQTKVQHNEIIYGLKTLKYKSHINIILSDKNLCFDYLEIIIMFGCNCYIIYKYVLSIGIEQRACHLL